MPLATQSLTRLSAAQWRVLNCLRHHAAKGKSQVSVHFLINEEECPYEDVTGLQARSMITVELGGCAINLAEEVSGSKWPITAMLRSDARLTGAGVRAVDGTPDNRVILALANHMRSGRQVHHVKRVADADDAVLFALEERGLIENRNPEGPVRLATFRRLPGELVVCLTGKGREYLPR